jgi:hypothetical protein
MHAINASSKARGRPKSNRRLSRRELNPGPERCRVTSSYTNHYTTEDSQVWAPAVARWLLEVGVGKGVYQLSQSIGAFMRVTAT